MRNIAIGQIKIKINNVKQKVRKEVITISIFSLRVSILYFFQTFFG